MRPLELTMQAFGPYVNQKPLMLSDLGETGIYAITGETGAGKTTIFDAIVYALYGKPSGTERSGGRSLRSTLAPDDLETVVRLRFLSKGKEYVIERKPAQTLRGNKTETPARQVLTMPDGSKVINEAEIRELIEKDVLGVTESQFRQTVMIAQGEFRRLLKANTNDRTEILRRIFNTEHFNDLTEKLKSLAKDCR